MDPQQTDQQQTLITYIQQQLQLGQTPDVIASQLAAANWPQEQILAAFTAVQSRMMPTSMQTPGTAADATPKPEANGQRHGRIRTGWILFKRSMQLLNGNRYLFRYLLMTWVVIIAIEAILVAISYFAYDRFFDHAGNNKGWGWVLIVISYIVIYSIINFYAAALAANILDIFRGKRQPYATYLGMARKRFGPIVLFSIIQSAVGIFLEYVVERIRFVGWLLAWLLGTAWSLGTMFVLPLIMDQDMSAGKSINESIGFFKKTWGENVTAKITVNAPLALLTIAVWALLSPLVIIAAINGLYPVFITLLIIYVIIQLSLLILGSFANNVINVALYHYAVNNEIPPGFSGDMLNQVFIQRKHFRKKDKQAADGR